MRLQTVQLGMFVLVQHREAEHSSWVKASPHRRFGLNHADLLGSWVPVLTLSWLDLLEGFLATLDEV